MSAETETTFTRAKSSAGEQARAAVEIQVCNFSFFFPREPCGFFFVCQEFQLPCMGAVSFAGGGCFEVRILMQALGSSATL